MIEFEPPVGEDPNLPKIFASQEEKDVNVEVAREALRMARLDAEVALTPEAKIAAEKKVKAAEAFFTRVTKGVIASTGYTAGWRQPPEK